MYGCNRTNFFRQERRRQERENLFYELASRVWKDDVQGTVEILAKDPTLVNCHQFNFYLPDKTNSILAYAEALNRKTIIQVLLGFGANSGAS